MITDGPALAAAMPGSRKNPEANIAPVEIAYTSMSPSFFSSLVPFAGDSAATWLLFVDRCGAGAGERYRLAPAAAPRPSAGARRSPRCRSGASSIPPHPAEEGCGGPGHRPDPVHTRGPAAVPGQGQT